MSSEGWINSGWLFQAGAWVPALGQGQGWCPCRVHFLRVFKLGLAVKTCYPESEAFLSAASKVFSRPSRQVATGAPCLSAYSGHWGEMTGGTEVTFHASTAPPTVTGKPRT